MRRSNLSNRKGGNATIIHITPFSKRPVFTNIVNQFIISKAIEPFFTLPSIKPNSKY